MRRRRISTLFTALALVSGCLRAQTMPPRPRPLPPAESHERMFLQYAEEGCVANIEMAKLAEKKSTDQDVISLAKSTRENHTQMSEGRAPIFQTKNLEPHKGLRPEYISTYKRLNDLSGDAFDRAYIEFVVKEDRQELEVFHYEAVMGKEQIQARAEKDQTTAKDHLSMSEALAKTRGITVEDTTRHPIIPSPSRGTSPSQ